jgi:hypothetical protein
MMMIAIKAGVKEIAVDQRKIFMMKTIHRDVKALIIVQRILMKMLTIKVLVAMIPA